MRRVLLVEDHRRLARFMERGLQELGLEVVCVETERAAAYKALNESFDLVVLDLMLPDGSGLNVLTRMRDAGKVVPVLVVSAKDTVEDRVTGLDTGADDYLVKPFSVAEFAARVRALLRRPDRYEAIQVGNVTIDPVARTATMGERSIAFSPRELDVLLVLARHLGETVSRTAILEAAWGVQSRELGRSLEVHLSSIRRRLRLAAATAHVETVRRVGYRLEPAPAEEAAPDA